MSEAQTPTPKGWKLVPVEPTREMVAAFVNVSQDISVTTNQFKYGYEAMLAAAPPAPADINRDAFDEVVKALEEYIFPLRHWTDGELSLVAAGDGFIMLDPKTNIKVFTTKRLPGAEIIVSMNEAQRAIRARAALDALAKGGKP